MSIIEHVIPVESWLWHLRVITGTAKGRRLQTPSGLDTRPTSEATKEAVFSIIQFEIEGANVLDLFAGSGQMGIEALSRGAKFCVFVDAARACRQVLRQNLSHTGLAAKARVVSTDADAFLKTGSGPFDIAFLDPPYGMGLAAKLLPQVAQVMRPGGAILCETAKDDHLPGTAGEFVLKKRYRYGRTAVTLYRMPEKPDEE